MQGPSVQPTPDQYGVIQRVAIQVMEHVGKVQNGDEVQFTVKISYLEIYQEKLVDLLLGPTEQPTDLKIRQGSVMNYHQIRRLIVFE